MVSKKFHISFSKSLEAIFFYCFLEPTDPEWQDGNPNDTDRIACINVHYVISRLLELVPM